jgi:hypothetical protein
MTCDNMGPMQRLWLCAGCGYLIDETLGAEHGPYLLTPDDERPVLCVPPGRSAGEYELAFGWAMSEVKIQHLGWLETYRRLCRLLDAVAAATVTLLLVLDATGNGLPDLVELAAHLVRLATG